MPRKKKLRPKRKRGRPATYTDEVYEGILFDVSEGTPLRVACREEGRPSPGAVCRRVVLDSEFAERYFKACQSRTHQMGAELLDIADDPDIEPAHKRVMVAARQFMLVKVLPALYGDRLTLDTTTQALVAFADMGAQAAIRAKATTGEGELGPPMLPHVEVADGAEASPE